jgi:transcriptional regulator with XRE-family HTH domain
MVSETRRHFCMHCGAQHRVVNGKWLRDIRVKADITMTRMARFYAGVSPQFLNNIEKNRRLCPPAVEQAYRALAADRERDRATAAEGC